MTTETPESDLHDQFVASLTAMPLPDGMRYGLPQSAILAIADAMLPVAQAHADERAAKALRDAATWMKANHYPGPGRHLINRATTFDPNGDPA